MNPDTSPTPNVSPFSLRRSILRLAPEVLSEIVFNCESTKDVVAFSKTSKRLHAISARRVYRYIKIFCGGLHPTAEDIGRISSLCLGLLRPDLGLNVRTLEIYDFRLGAHMQLSLLQGIDQLINISHLLLAMDSSRPIVPILG